MYEGRVAILRRVQLFATMRVRKHKQKRTQAVNAMLTPTELRKNIYNILDQVLETGKPVEVKRRGQVLRIVPARPVDKFQRLTRRADVIKGDPDDLIHIEWEVDFDLP